MQTAQIAEMVAKGVEETAAGPATTGAVVMEATISADSTEAACMRKAAQHWERQSLCVRSSGLVVDSAR